MVSMAKLWFLTLLLSTTGCASLWPWMYAAEVVEESQKPRRTIQTHKPLGPHISTRAITKREKGFDYNQDGYLQKEEILYFKRAQKVREQEKLLTGQK